MYICYNSISVSNSVSLSVESLKLWWLNFHVFMASPNQRIYILNKNNHESLNFPTETENRLYPHE